MRKGVKPFQEAATASVKSFNNSDLLSPYGELDGVEGSMS
jgi:hypothetical protein